MRILFLAPQPFYQERGTPIAVRLATQSLAKQLSTGVSDPIDLVVYNEGSDISIPGVKILRIPTPKWLSGVRPGISCKKIVCDIVMLVYTLRLILQSKESRYDLIHAVEESVFIAWIAKRLFGIPYVYDMDSSLAQQLTERWWWCKPALSLLRFMEGVAIRGSIAVAPMCEALKTLAIENGSSSTVVLRDVSLLTDESGAILDRSEVFGLNIGQNERVVLYVGNLEPYQGIDLLLEACAGITDKLTETRVVVVGGTKPTIERYQAKAEKLGIFRIVDFIGPRPVQALASLLGAADVLVSPRIKGSNTPMKVYSYLHSGTALLATDLPTHQQVLNDEIALMAAADADSFGAGLVKLLNDEGLRRRLGDNARRIARELYTLEAFEEQLATLYRGIHSSLVGQERESVEVVENL
jgi:glycosyltransferase involved in cell wall biosynthesis